MKPYKSIKEYKLFGHLYIEMLEAGLVYWVDQNCPLSFSITLYRKLKRIFGPSNMSIPLLIKIYWIISFFSCLLWCVSCVHLDLILFLQLTTQVSTYVVYSACLLVCPRASREKSGLEIENELNFCQVHKLKLSFKKLGYTLLLMFCQLFVFKFIWLFLI